MRTAEAGATRAVAPGSPAEPPSAAAAGEPEDDPVHYATAVATPPAAAAGADSMIHASSAATPTAPAAAAAAAARPPTPLEQRQWQRVAQRSLRLAITAFKEAETRSLDATTQGTALATHLTNSILSERYLPSLALPDVLKGVEGLQEAARQKLQRQQQRLLQQLEEQLLVITDAVESMDAAVTEVNSNLDPSKLWQQSMAVFHTLALPESCDLLLQILEMYKQEASSKQGLLDSYRQLFADSSGRQGSKSGSRVGLSEGLDVDALRKVLTAAVTTWMVRPFVDLERCQQLLQVLTDEMVGF